MTEALRERWGGWAVAGMLAALVAVVNVLRTGYLGSELVQRFGAGVEPVMRRLQQTPAPPPPPPPLPPSTPAQ